MSPEISSPRILSGPFGSLLNDRHSITTEAAFAGEQHEIIAAILREYRSSGVTQPITPTFGAGPRGPKAGGVLTREQWRWNADAAKLTHEVFGDKNILGSVAPILDTSGHDDTAWMTVRNPIERARELHRWQAMTLRRTGVVSAPLAEAVHDFYEAVGFVLAAKDAGFDSAVVSFEPTHEGVPRNDFAIQSYAEVKDRLQGFSGGNLEVQIGLNCGSAHQIFELLSSNPAGTFTVVYPNKSVDKGGRFRELADANSHRTEAENREFAQLRSEREISAQERLQLVELALRQRVNNIGLCCGAAPDDIAAVAADLDALHLSQSDKNPICQP